MSDNIKENCGDELKVGDNDDEAILTMVDVLEEEKQLEEDAFAVLGAADDKNCTYSQGYVKRQALYSCKTCKYKDEKPAGICLACSYHCHEGHDLVELYTKRNFRCDCGNSLFENKKCSLQSDKDELNSGNNYNQNFKGVYCTCARPYPDPEDTVNDEMIQCIVCEDWYHTRHLNLTAVPDLSDYSEMICHTCTEALPFLRYYIGYSVNKIKSEPSGEDAKLITVDDAGEASKTEPVNGLITNDVKENNESKPLVENVRINANGDSSLRNLSTSSDNKTASVSESKMAETIECRLKLLSDAAHLNSNCKTASFWKDGFRNELCKCSSCLDLYTSHGVKFLVDPLDTVQVYEEEGEDKRNKSRCGLSYERGLEALSSLDRVKQLEAIHSYNEMQEHLKEYLSEFAKNKKVVRAEDIKEFFNEMQSRKRQKVEVPYFCH